MGLLCLSTIRLAKKREKKIIVIITSIIVIITTPRIEGHQAQIYIIFQSDLCILYSFIYSLCKNDYLTQQLLVHAYSVFRTATLRFGRLKSNTPLAPAVTVEVFLSTISATPTSFIPSGSAAVSTVRLALVPALTPSKVRETGTSAVLL